MEFMWASARLQGKSPRPGVEMAEGEDVSNSRQLQALRAAALGLLLMAGVAIFLIVAGAFDPKPYGTLVDVDQQRLQRVSGEGELHNPLIAPWPALPGNFSIRLTAAHDSGEPDSGYGLAIGNDGGRLVVALSPLGYVTVREDKGDAEPIDHMPWQTWPHAQPGTAENEIWLDVAQDGDGATITAWINRELLWQGKMAFWPQEVSLYQVTFGDPATVNFRQAEWFAEP